MDNMHSMESRIELDPPHELAGGALYRLGTRVATDGRLSWVPSGITASLPLNVYVLVAPERILVLDTGPVVLYPQLADQIRDLRGDRDLAVLVTRNDPEAMGGVGTLLPQLEPSVFYYYGGGSILEWVWDERDGPAASGDLFDTVPVASPMQIEFAPGRTLQVLRPPLAVLNTVWVYDPGSKALHTSDGLGYLPADGAPDSMVDEQGDVDAERARAFIQARFDWIARLIGPRLADELAALVQELDIGLLAPSHGVLVGGGTAVRRYLATVLRALQPAPGA